MSRRFLVVGLGFGLSLVGCASRAPDASPRGQAETVDVRVPEPAAEQRAAPRATASAEPLDGERLLLDPSLSVGQAPDVFRVRFDTTAGSFDVECLRAWAPHGVDRVHQLVRIGFFRDVAIYRVVSGFVAQFGIHGDPIVSAAWKNAEIPVDSVEASNHAGTLTFAMAAQPTSRTTQLFFNLVDNPRLDKMGFAPVCKVLGPGMEVVRRFFDGYGEKATKDQGRIQREGNYFLKREYPELDRILDARVLE